MIVPCIYLAGFVLLIFPIYRRVEQAFPGIDADASDRAMNGALAFLYAAIWPAGIVGWVAFSLSRRIWTGDAGAHGDTRTEVGPK